MRSATTGQTVSGVLDPLQDVLGDGDRIAMLVDHRDVGAAAAALGVGLLDAVVDGDSVADEHRRDEAHPVLSFDS